ncbi:MAG: DUF3187 family protein [Planctomycetota bacterium]
MLHRSSASLLGLLTACTALESPAPLHARNQHPAQLIGIHQGARAARPAQALELGLVVDHSSLWLRPGAGRDRIELDGELTRAELGLRFPLGSSADLELQLPVLHAAGGGLDTFIEAWHEFFGLPQNQRDLFPRNRFVVRAERSLGPGNLEDVYVLAPGTLELGDLPIFLSWFPLRDSQGLSFGLRGGIELPSGEQSRGLGNGEPDASLGFLSQWDLGPWSLFGWGSRSWVGASDLARAAGFRYARPESFGLGVEFGALERLSGLVQVEWEESLLGALDETHAKSDQALISLGGRYRASPGVAWELAVAEDLIRNVSADISFHLGLRVKL